MKKITEKQIKTEKEHGNRKATISLARTTPGVVVTRRSTAPHLGGKVLHLM